MRAATDRLRRLGPAVALPLLFFAAACSRENRLKRVDFSYENAPPDAAVVSSTSIELQVGEAVAVRAHPVMTGDDLGEGDRLELRPAAPATLGVAETDEPNVFVLYGVAEGAAAVQAFVNGEPGPVIGAYVRPAP